MKYLSFKRPLLFLCLGIAGTLVVFAPLSAQRGSLDNPFFAAEFTHQDESDWINSKPLSIKDLRGKVVLLDFWTFECWNCYRSFPWLNDLEHRMKDNDFKIIGVHSPEFEREKVLGNILEKVKEFELTHPVMVDNDHSYWKKMRNRYWPAFYLIDKNGFVRSVFVGETHQGDQQARAIEKTIHKLLAETPATNP